LNLQTAVAEIKGKYDLSIRDINNAKLAKEIATTKLAASIAAYDIAALSCATLGGASTPLELA